MRQPQILAVVQLRRSLPVGEMTAYTKNDIIILLFIQQKYKDEKIAFLMYRNTSKHVFFLALGVNRTARDAIKAKFTRVLT